MDEHQMVSLNGDDTSTRAAMEFHKGIATDLAGDVERLEAERDEGRWIPAPPGLEGLTTEQLRAIVMDPLALAQELAQQHLEADRAHRSRPREWLTETEATRYMGLTVGSSTMIRRWYREGRFPALDLGSNGLRIDRADLDAAMTPKYYEKPQE